MKCCTSSLLESLQRFEASAGELQLFWLRPMFRDELQSSSPEVTKVWMKLSALGKYIICLIFSRLHNFINVNGGIQRSGVTGAVNRWSTFYSRFKQI